MGPKAVEYDLSGEVGDLLRETAYIAKVVIERVDGGAITDGDRARLDPLMEDVTELGTHDPEVRERAATRRLAKARERLAAKATTKRTG